MAGQDSKLTAPSIDRDALAQNIRLAQAQCDVLAMLACTGDLTSLMKPSLNAALLGLSDLLSEIGDMVDGGPSVAKGVRHG